MILYFLCPNHLFLIEEKVKGEFLYPQLYDLFLIGKIKVVLLKGKYLNLENNTKCLMNCFQPVKNQGGGTLRGTRVTEVYRSLLCSAARQEIQAF